MIFSSICRQDSHARLFSQSGLLYFTSFELYLLHTRVTFDVKIARVLNQRCYLHIGNVDIVGVLRSSLSLLVGFSIQDEAMDVARGTHYRADVICMLS